MQISIDYVHTIVDIITPVVIGIGSLIIRNVILSTKNEIQESTSKLRLEMVTSNNEVKEELTKHNNNTQKSLEIHQAEDSLQFDAMKQTLSRIESKL